MLMMLTSICLAVATAADARFVAIIRAPAPSQGETSDKYEYFEPLGINADRTRLLARVENDLVFWDVAANKPVGRWEKILPDPTGDGSEIPAVAVSDDGRWLGIADGRTWKLWNVAGRKAVATFVLPKESIRVLVVSPDGKTALTANHHNVRVWDVPTGREKGGYTGPAEVCWVASNAAFDEHVLYDRRATELVWLKNSGAVDRRAKLADPPISDDRYGGDAFRWTPPLRATPDGKSFVYPGEEKWVTLDRKTGAVTAKVGQSQEKADTSSNAQAPRLWTLDPTGKTIIGFAGGREANVRVIDRATGKTLARNADLPYGYYRFLAVSANGDEIYLSRDQINEFGAFETKTGKRLRHLGTIGKLLEPGRKAEPSFAFKDGLFASETQFLVLNESWQLHLHDIANPLRVVRKTTVPGDGREYAMTLSPTGNTLAVVRYGDRAADGAAKATPELHLWNVREGNWASVEVLPKPRAARFTPDGEYAVVECEGLEKSQVFVVIDVLTGRKKHTVRAPMGEGEAGNLLPGPTGELGWERGYTRDPDFRWELDCKTGEFRSVPVVWRERWEARATVAADRRSDLAVSDERRTGGVTFGSRRYVLNTAYFPLVNSAYGLQFSPDSRHFAGAGDTGLGDAFTGRYYANALPGKFLAFSPTGDRIAVWREADIGILSAASVLPKPAAKTLTVARAKAHWRNLSNLDTPERAKRPAFESAMLALVASPAAALEAAQAELKPVPPIPEETFAALFAQLDDESTDVRLRAFDTLGTFDRRVLAKIDALQTSGASNEAKRLARKAAEAIPDGAPAQPQDIHAVNAVEVLERIGTADALALLARSADGDPAATLTREAAAAHTRLKRLREWRGRK